MGRLRRYATATERQRAHRQKKRERLSREAADYARLVALQDEAAQRHLAQRFDVPHLQKHATAEQLQLQNERKERDMADCLFVLQTLVADFGYEDVDRSVLQPLRQTPRPCAQTS
jgi:hypothetical protein